MLQREKWMRWLRISWLYPLQYQHYCEPIFIPNVLYREGHQGSLWLTGSPKRGANGVNWRIYETGNLLYVCKKTKVTKDPCFEQKVLHTSTTRESTTMKMSTDWLTDQLLGLRTDDICNPLNVNWSRSPTFMRQPVKFCTKCQASAGAALT